MKNQAGDVAILNIFDHLFGRCSDLGFAANDVRIIDHEMRCVHACRSILDVWREVFI